MTVAELTDVFDLDLEITREQLRPMLPMANTEGPCTTFGPGCSATFPYCSNGDTCCISARTHTGC
jgi:hypothetical protein